MAFVVSMRASLLADAELRFRFFRRYRARMLFPACLGRFRGLCRLFNGQQHRAQNFLQRAHRTGTSNRFSRRRSTSYKSGALSFGISTSFTPSRVGGHAFFFEAAYGQHLPVECNLTRSWATSEAHRAAGQARHQRRCRVTPADGPSFGRAPSGACMWISISLKTETS